MISFYAAWQPRNNEYLVEQTMQNMVCIHWKTADFSP